MDENIAIANEEPTQQASVLYALHRLENLIHDMNDTVFGPQNIEYKPEAKRETIGVHKAMEQFMTRLEAGLDFVHNNLAAIQIALSQLPNQGYKGHQK